MRIVARDQNGKYLLLVDGTLDEALTTAGVVARVYMSDSQTISRPIHLANLVTRPNSYQRYELTEAETADLLRNVQVVEGPGLDEPWLTLGQQRRQQRAKDRELVAA